MASDPISKNSQPKLEELPPLSWSNVLIAVFLLGLNTFRIMANPYRWLNWVGIGLGLFLAWLEYSKWRDRRELAQIDAELDALGHQLGALDAIEPTDEDQDEKTSPLRSLVFLLAEPRDLSSQGWVPHLGHALGVEFTGREDATNFVLPMPHPALEEQDLCYMIKVPKGTFWLFSYPTTYVSDVQAWASHTPDQRLQGVMTAHRAWLSVDLLNWHAEVIDPAEVYAEIGKIMAALAGPDVLAILCPELKRCNEFDPSLLPILRGGDPRRLFENPTFAPVLIIKPEDEQMEAATAEARARWPEFLALWAQRDLASKRPFVVKAPFAEGEDGEFMWMSVTDVQKGTIHGVLANQPHRLLNFHEGQSVTVPVAEIVDWLCADTHDKPLGGWTQQVLTRLAKR
jgi:uncharacterized protein YegJ (DUF2314 family)